MSLLKSSCFAGIFFLSSKSFPKKSLVAAVSLKVSQFKFHWVWVVFSLALGYFVGVNTRSFGALQLLISVDATWERRGLSVSVACCRAGYRDKVRARKAVPLSGHLIVPSTLDHATRISPCSSIIKCYLKCLCIFREPVLLLRRKWRYMDFTDRGARVSWISWIWIVFIFCSQIPGKKQ
jgi:hypothetical protein